MRRFAQTLELVDDPAVINEYVERHRTVWPEVLRRLRSIGILSMRVYLHGNRLFMYAEAEDTFDAARDFPTYASDPMAQAWDLAMRKIQRRVPAADASDGAWWSPMREVFDLGEQLARVESRMVGR